MRTTLAVCGAGAGAGEPRGLRARVAKMKRLLWLKAPRRAEVHTDAEPGVWLTRFQLLETAGHGQVSHREPRSQPLPMLRPAGASRNTCDQ